MTQDDKLRELEAALAQERARFQTLMDNVVDAIIVIDAEATILPPFNPAAESIFGYAAAEIIGEPIETLMPEPYHSEHAGYIASYLRTGDKKIIGIGREVTGLRKNGEQFPMDLAVGEMRSGDELQFVGSVRDLTQRKEAEQQLRQAYKMDALGQLTGGVAHDFNNLLAVLMMDLELLDDLVEPDSLAKELVEEAREVASSGAQLTQRLLAFSRRQPLEPRTVDLNELVGGTIGLLRRTLGETIEIDTVGPTGLWKTRADPGQVENAILNLALNARDAMPNGGQLTIETSNAVLDEDYSVERNEVSAGHYVRLSVTDTGTGMPDDVLEKAFDPFFTTKGAGAGTGLGLSMIYGFAKQSEGHVAIYSEIGQGTTVDIFLPRSQAADAAEADKHPGDRSDLRGSETILLVEDHPKLRLRASRLLGDLGYTVLEAENAFQALEILERNPAVDLLFTDMIMPGGMDGAELAREARSRYPELRVLFTTGYAEYAQIQSGRIEHGAELLRKPYTRSDLSLKVRKMLDVRRA